MEILKLELERLKKEEEVLREILKENRKKRDEIMVAIYKGQTGLRKGDRLKLKSGQSGEITGFKVDYSLVNPIMRFYKKDGTLGKRESILYDWEIEDAVIEKSGETD